MHALVKAAREMAIRAHGEQRYGAHPYVKHLDDVAAFAEPYGVTAEIVAYLHDTLEDTALTGAEIEATFDRQIRSFVEALTDPPGKNRKERKAAAHEKLSAIREGGSLSVALIVKAADRLANLKACVADRNTSLLSMYRKEHQAFVAAVCRPGLNNSLFTEMDALFRAQDTAAEPSQ